jgi:phosphonate transport system ATP-binding protein
MLVVEGLTCRFGAKAAVDNASFSVEPGSFVGVIGRSGAGKSTLLRMINRLAEPSEGKILFDGVDVTAQRGRNLRHWRARSAMIFQQFNLGGQQQRVAIARALVQQPNIILADEPIASLDPRNTRIVMDALLRINKHFGITVLCNLHSLDLARSYCDRLIGMATGRIVFDGAPAMLTDHIARELYDLEANEVMGTASMPALDDPTVAVLGSAAAA